VRKPASYRTLKSDLAKVDAHSVRAHEYKELPELTKRALSHAVVNKVEDLGRQIRASSSPFGFRWMSSSAGQRLARVGRRALRSARTRCVDSGEARARVTRLVQNVRSLREEMKPVARGERPARADAGRPSFNSVDAAVGLWTPDNRHFSPSFGIASRNRLPSS
jgi:uncharacterized membrane protein YccC